MADGPPTRRRLFVLGAFGLLPAVTFAGLAEVVLRAFAVEGDVGGGFFIAAAALTPVLGVGLLVQLVTALTRRTRDLMREVQRFDQEMSADPPRMDEESHLQRKATWHDTSLFRHALVPFGGGVALQVILTEAIAASCVATGTGERFLALALGAEIIALFAYLLFFNAALTRVSEGRTADPPAPEGA